jgi:membrane protein implicated in regulation of membrane protease activity
MKKFSIIAAAVIRVALLLLPGLAFGWWACQNAMTIIAVLAAVGVETLFLVAFTLVVVTLQAYHNTKAKHNNEPEMHDDDV